MNTAVCRLTAGKRLANDVLRRLTAARRRYSKQPPAALCDVAMFLLMISLTQKAPGSVHIVSQTFWSTSFT